MSFYQTIKIENANNVENIKKIEHAASEAIDYAIQYVEHAVSDTNLNDDGIIHLTFVAGQDVDEDEVTTEFQRNFNEKFGEIVKSEYSELI